MSKLLPVQGACSLTYGMVWFFPPQGRREAHRQELSRARATLLPRWEAAAGWQVCAAVLRAGMAPEARASACCCTPKCLPAFPCPPPAPHGPRAWVQMVLLMLFVSSNFLKLSDLDWQMYSDFLICFLHIFAVFFHKNYSVQQLGKKQSTARR